jgi:HPr kinase/phosphorylase
MKKIDAHQKPAQAADKRGGELRHCCVVECGGTGVLIEGKSGSGKTSLAFGLIESARREGREAQFVADDQAMLSRHGDELWAAAIAPIAGKAELRGLGIVAVQHRHRSRISLIASLVEDERVERLPAPETQVLLGIAIPVLRLPCRHESQCVRIVRAWLDGARPACDQKSSD